MMDWAITIGLMLCILIGGCLSAAQATNYFRTPASEPLQSQHLMQIGMAWLLAAIVPFWRSHQALGVLAFLLGAATLLHGCISLYHFAKEQAHAKRIADTMPDVFSGTPLATVGLTGKASSKRRRRATRKAAIAADASRRPACESSDLSEPSSQSDVQQPS